MGAGLCLILCNQLSAQTQKKTAWSKAGNLAHLLINDQVNNYHDLKGGMYFNRSIKTILADILKDSWPVKKKGIPKTYMQLLKPLLDSALNKANKKKPPLVGNLRPDIVRLEGSTRHVWEIKVNHPDAINTGKQQLTTYIKYLNMAFKRVKPNGADFMEGDGTGEPKFIFDVLDGTDTVCLCMLVRAGQNAKGIIAYEWSIDCSRTDPSAFRKFRYEEPNQLIPEVQPVLNAIYKVEKDQNDNGKTGETELLPSENGALFGEDAADYPLD